MRPLVWVQAAAFAVISAVLASPASAQTATDPATLPEVPQLAGAPAPASETTLPEVPRVDPPPAPPVPDILQNLMWIEQPDARDFSRHYPDAAGRASMSGHVTLDCVVDADGRLDCVVTREEPAGYGFAEATLAISRYFRVAPETRDGVPTEGGRVRRTIRWLVAS